jgi:hypothetical protein
MAPTRASYHSGSLISQFLFSENQRSGSSIFGGEWKSITSILPQKKNYNERTVRNTQFFAGSFMKPTGSSSFRNNWKWRFFNSDFPCKKKNWQSNDDPVFKIVTNALPSSLPLFLQMHKSTTTCPLDVWCVICCDGGDLNATQRMGHLQSEGSLLHPEQNYCMLLLFSFIYPKPLIHLFLQKQMDDAHYRLCVLLCTFWVCILQPVQNFSNHYRPGMCITGHKVYNGQ